MKNNMEMKLSICIVNYNSGPLLVACLESIKKHPPAFDYEIIVVDNHSTDGSQACVRDYEYVRLIQNETNKGFAEANNQAFDSSRGEYLLLINADTEVQTGALDELLVFVDEHPQAGLVSAKLLNPDNSPQIGFNVRRLPGIAMAFCQLLLLDEIFPGNPITQRAGCWDLDYDQPQMVEQPAASALLFRRATWEQIGGFDTLFPNWYNDCDLCKRACDAGFEIWFCPSANVLHYGGGGSASRPITSRMVEMYQSQRLYFHKHFGHFGYWFVSGLIVCGMILRSTIMRVFYNFQSRFNASSIKLDSKSFRLACEAVLVDTLRTWKSLHEF